MPASSPPTPEPRRRLLLGGLALAPVLAGCGGGAGAPGDDPAPPLSPYRYGPPAALADGWTAASLADVGVDTAAVEALVERIRQPAQPGLRFVDGLLIARRGRLVLDLSLRTALDFTDAWAQNRQPGLHAIHSVTKSFAARGAPPARGGTDPGDALSRRQPQAGRWLFCLPARGGLRDPGAQLDPCRDLCAARIQPSAAITAAGFRP